MKIRKITFTLCCALLCLAASGSVSAEAATADAARARHKKESVTVDGRARWVALLDKISNPVIDALSRGELKKEMPFESLSSDPSRVAASYLEAFGRTVCGLGPWLALGPDDTPEGKLRAEYIAKMPSAIRNAVDPASPDRMTFSGGNDQSLVDAAFLSEGILRAGDQIWDKLDAETQAMLISCLKETRSITPKESNWLLFASMVEAAILEYTGECDTYRLNYGVHRFLKDGWYKGDGVYGDGMEFHLDYYNSLVISPLLTDVLKVMVDHSMIAPAELERQLTREKRLSAELERVISPEGTYPVVGRSIVYRVGSFHALAHSALLGNLPDELDPAQVRCALGAVMERQFSNPLNFNGKWLTVGFCGNQINMSEAYINTGSLYMVTAAFLPLGLAADDPFWTRPDADWTSKKAWDGIDVGADHALRDLNK